jgi:DNA-binding ferritin-like protein
MSKKVYKRNYRTEERAKKLAALREDLRGTSVAYKCTKRNHWHIGYKPVEELKEGR